MTCHSFDRYPQLAIKMLELGADSNDVDRDGLHYLDHIINMYNKKPLAIVALFILLRYDFQWR
jgi:hypothetical protein